LVFAPESDWEVRWSLPKDSLLFKYDPLHDLVGCYLFLLGVKYLAGRHYTMSDDPTPNSELI